MNGNDSFEKTIKESTETSAWSTEDADSKDRAVSADQSGRGGFSMKIKYKKKAGKSAKKKACICAGICLLAVLFALRWQIFKAFAGVETFCIYTDEISEDEYDAATAALEKRIDCLSHGAYTWQENEDRVTFGVPSGLFLGEDPIEVIDREICAEKIMMIGLKYDGAEDLTSLATLSREKELDRVITLPGAVILTLSDEAQADMKDYTSDGDKVDCVVFDADTDHEKRYPARAFRCKYIVVSLIGKDMGLPGKLKKMQFTDEPVYADLHSHCDDVTGRIDWEDPYRLDTAEGGLNQTEFDYLLNDGNVACMSYSIEQFYTGLLLEEEKSDPGSIKNTIRRRLDALGVDYAMGTDRYDEDHFWVALPRDEITAEEAELLGESVTILLGSRYGNDFVDYSVSMAPVRVSPDGMLSASVADADALNELKYDLSRRAENGDDLYLYADELAFARTDAETALADLESNGTVTFDTDCFSEAVRNSEDPEAAMRFIEALCENPLDVNYSLERGYTLDANGDLMHGDDGIKPGLSCCMVDEDTIEELNGKYADTEIRYNETFMALNLIYTYGRDQNGYDDRPLRSLRKIIDENRELIDSEKVHRISVRVRPSKRTVYSEEGMYTYEGEDYFVGDDGLYLILGKNWGEHPEEYVNEMSFSELSVDYYSRDSFFRTAIEKAEEDEDDWEYDDQFEGSTPISYSWFEPGSEYVLQEDMNVREEPSKKSRILEASELSDEDKAKAAEGDDAVLRKGSTVTCLETKGNWIRIGSGWICGYEEGNFYIEEAESLTNSEEQVFS